MMTTFRRYIASIIILVGLDQAAKYYVTHIMTQTINLFSWLRIAPVHNFGICWGIGSSYSTFIRIPVLLVSLGLILFLAQVFIRKNSHSYRIFSPELWIVAGGIGNLLDRCLSGFVVDFVQVFIGNYKWPVFNFADVYIVLGALLFLRKLLIDGHD